MLHVNVTWNKRKFENIELNTELPALVFKTQLFSLTGVQPDRQKIMVKGGMLKDDTDLKTLGIKEGHTFMMMGTPADDGASSAAAAAPAEPPKKIVFLEDMSEDELHRVTNVPSGLQNLGNTCYMNATLQCMRAIPELSTALSQFQGSLRQTDPNEAITAALRDVFRDLNNSGQSVMPLVFLQVFRMAFPQFAQMTSEGGHRGYAQQDAEEAWSQLMSTIAPKLKDQATGRPVIEQYMGIEFTNEWRNTESEEEPVTFSQDKGLKVACHISTETGSLERCLRESLKENIEKNSSLLGRTCVYSKVSRISRLPAYLTVSFVRFFWRRDTEKKAKILRKVTFPLMLDMYEFCTDELKKKLQPARARIAEHDEAVLAVQRENKTRPKDTPPKELPVLQLDKPADAAGENMSGMYELFAVLTHQGRTSDSGHYIAWVRHDNDQWWKFDDDKVTQVTTDEILRLDGGGEWHMAYQCLYRERTK